METLAIQVSHRAERGRHNKKIRKNKWVPAIVYGHGQKNISFSLDIRDAEKYSKKEYENKIFTFKSESKELEGLKVIKKAVSYHKVNHKPIHMDFLSLDMNKRIRVHVDINFKGIPKGVKEEGGVFNIVLRHVEMECLPGDIPASIDLDVSHLGLNENIHVSDLSLPEKAKLISKGEGTLCTLAEAKEEKEETAPDAPPAENVKPEEETKTQSKEEKK